MKILLLGGTGAMGTPLVELLRNTDNDIFVTTRQDLSDEKINYINGNARDNDFLKTVVENDFFDVIFDFTVCGTESFKEKISFVLEKTRQYFYFSSCRVYADSKGKITEKSDRLLDVINDEEYLKTDEYALAKAREENILVGSGKKNWTIIRPYITYNSYRLQLGVYEKENWLNRILEGKAVAFPMPIASSITSLTYGNDVARALMKLINNEKAFGEIIQIVNEQSLTWNEVFEIYSSVIKEKTGINSRVKYLDNCDSLCRVWGQYQIRYDRMYNREFDSSKLIDIIGPFEFTDVKKGLTKSLEEFLDNPVWRSTNTNYELWSDVHTGDWTKLSKIPGKRMKMKYIFGKITKKY